MSIPEAPPMATPTGIPPTSARVDPRAAAFSGAFSGAVSSIATHPLDVARTKLAVERTLRGGAPPRYRGTGGTLRRVFREEGIRGLFRGITPAVISHAPAAALFFSTYTFVKSHVSDIRHGKDAANTDILSSSLGAGAGWFMTCIFLNPLFVLKTKQQTQFVPSRTAIPKYTGLISSFRVVVAEQGVRGLYAGVVAAMAGAPGAMLQMPLYEYLKRMRLKDPNDKPSHTQVALASATSSCFAGVLMYPMEVVRLRLQAQGGVKHSSPFRSRSSSTSSVHSKPNAPSAPSQSSFNTPSPTSAASATAASVHHAHSSVNPSTPTNFAPAAATEYRGIADCFKKIFVQEGVGSFYKGIGSSLIRALPQSIIGLSCYETMLRLTTCLVQWYDS